MKVSKYEDTNRNAWNAFILKAKNSTFLFDRNFLEYHSDRFTDHSLIITENEKIIALLPANFADGRLISHRGLTYGGIVFENSIKLRAAISVFYHVLKYLHGLNIAVFELKMIPSFFCNYPTADTEYVLFLLKAELYRRDAALVIDYQHRIPYSGNIRREGINAEKKGAFIKYDDSPDAFWNDVLIPNLKDKFGVAPVHSPEEIKLLKERFPDNIIQVNAYFNERVAAGATLFIDNGVVHCQYISSTEEGRKAGCLNYLFKNLTDHYSSGYRYFDFGIVNEDSGKFINNGMLFWKEGFGGRTQKHDFYRMNSSDYALLEQYI